MQELAEKTLKQIVNHPDQLQVRQLRSKKIIVLEISAAKQDLGTVMGREGKTVNCIRTLVRAAAARIGKRAAVEVVEK